MRPRVRLLPNLAYQVRTLKTRRRGRIGDDLSDTDDDSGDLGAADTSTDTSSDDSDSGVFSSVTDLFSGGDDSSASASTGNSLVQDADSDASSLSSDFTSIIGPTGSSNGGGGLGPSASTSSATASSTTVPFLTPSQGLSYLFASVPTWAWIAGAVVLAGVVAAVVQKRTAQAA